MDQSKYGYESLVSIAYFKLVDVLIKLKTVVVNSDVHTGVEKYADKIKEVLKDGGRRLKHGGSQVLFHRACFL
ncbi:hypothetical protein AAP_02810 [Ascosphaera apis ARSEF 7405]|uniref:Uncharacterized protein n=1 Tax=Ascosphaera apis ARSEF 7405 TaxID=392613 RepID=A0A167ZJ59_9EURO|nr:hypothetical protein AAP_02810 [Ascosphaera apis ARSEF 7405]